MKIQNTVGRNTVYRRHILAGLAALPLVLGSGFADAAEKVRIAKEIAKVGAEVKKVTDRLGNPQFMARAPEEVVEELRERQVDWEAKGRRLEAALARLG